MDKLQEIGYPLKEEPIAGHILYSCGKCGISLTQIIRFYPHTTSYCSICGTKIKKAVDG